MEEDIKVLEEYIKEQKEFIKQFNLEEIEDGTESQRRLQAIENLIKGYKELEEKRKTTMEVISANYIHKDKVREKIEEIINNSSRFNCISPLNCNEEYYKTRFAVDKLQELLQEGDDK